MAPVFHRSPGMPGFAGICPGRGCGEGWSFQGLDDEGNFSGGSREDLRGSGASGRGKGSCQDQHRGTGRPQFSESGLNQRPGAPGERHHRGMQYGLRRQTLPDGGPFAGCEGSRFFRYCAGGHHGCGRGVHYPGEGQEAPGIRYRGGSFKELWSIWPISKGMPWAASAV